VRFFAPATRANCAPPARRNRIGDDHGDQASRPDRPGLIVAATRRLAAILAADLVGYSRLMGLDEEGTLVRLRALRAELLDPKITVNNGRLVKTTGDGFLVEFNSVIDALRCASDIQIGMAGQQAVDPDRRFLLRIGVHQGDIVVEDGDIFGNGVNIAARLEGIAEPGGICISERVQEDAAGRIDLVFEDMGEQQLKNIARPIRAYHVRITVPEVAGSEKPPLSETEVILPPEPPPESGEAAERCQFPFLAASMPGADDLFAGEPRSIERLGALVSDWLERKVEIVQSPGAWKSLSLEHQARLPAGDGPGTSNRLGVDSTIGFRARNPRARIVIRVGPLDRASFAALLPGQAAWQRLSALVDAFFDGEMAFAVNPVLAGAELAPLSLGAEGDAVPRLGWNSWVPAPGSPTAGIEAPDASDASFDAEMGKAEDPAKQVATNAAFLG
jgi:class 3 adenylate cyclase